LEHVASLCQDPQKRWKKGAILNKTIAPPRIFSVSLQKPTKATNTLQQHVLMAAKSGVDFENLNSRGEAENENAKNHPINPRHLDGSKGQQGDLDRGAYRARRRHALGGRTRL
jgi:hypothetical protein